MREKILVTGGAGYIGSHIINEILKSSKYDVFSIDDLSTGNEIALSNIKNYEVDIRDYSILEDIFEKENIDHIIHCAAKSTVEESFAKKQLYYDVNVQGTKNLVDLAKKYNVNKTVFSSTASVYGEPEHVPIGETDLLNPINPYGETKLEAEKLIQTLSDYTILRYFNVAGADFSNHNGQGDKVQTHLIKIAAQAATGKRKSVFINGTDFKTRDGTCERDYIHVVDLARAHILALEDHQNEIYNVGAGRGFTVRETLNEMRRISDFDVFEQNARPGDPASLIADISKIETNMGFKPSNSDIHTICKTAYNWEKFKRF